MLLAVANSGGSKGPLARWAVLANWAPKSLASLAPRPELARQRWSPGVGDRYGQGNLKPGDDAADYLQGASLGLASVAEIADPQSAYLE